MVGNSSTLQGKLEKSEKATKYNKDEGRKATSRPSTPSKVLSTSKPKPDFGNRSSSDRRSSPSSLSRKSNYSSTSIVADPSKDSRSSISTGGLTLNQRGINQRTDDSKLNSTKKEPTVTSKLIDQERDRERRKDKETEKDKHRKEDKQKQTNKSKVNSQDRPKKIETDTFVTKENSKIDKRIHSEREQTTKLNDKRIKEEYNKSTDNLKQRLVEDDKKSSREIQRKQLSQKEHTNKVNELATQAKEEKELRERTKKEKEQPQVATKDSKEFARKPVLFITCTGIHSETL